MSYLLCFARVTLSPHFSFSLGTFRGFFLSPAISLDEDGVFLSSDDDEDGNDETMRREFYERTPTLERLNNEIGYFH